MVRQAHRMVPTAVSRRGTLFRRFRPILPVRGMDLDRSAQSGINPGIAGAAAGKDEGMNRPAAVDDGQPHIAVGRDVRERVDLMPHAGPRAREAGIRFDPAQIRG